MTYYLGIFATPGGDKHHLFSLSGDGGVITNSMGPVTLENYVATEHGFSANMPAGPGQHHFDAVYIPNGIHVVGTVIMEGNPVGTYEADMARVDSDLLPADPEGATGPPDGPKAPPPEAATSDPIQDPVYQPLYPGAYSPTEAALFQQTAV